MYVHINSRPLFVLVDITLNPFFTAYADSWSEILGASVNAVVSLGLVTVAWFLVAPLFGLQFSKRSSRLPEEDLYETYYDTGYGYEGQYGGYYGGYEGRSFGGAAGGVVARMGKALINR